MKKYSQVLEELKWEHFTPNCFFHHMNLTHSTHQQADQKKKKPINNIIISLFVQVEQQYFIDLPSSSLFFSFLNL